MSSFWGVEVKPGKPYTLTHSEGDGRLRLTQATLGLESGKEEKGSSGKKCVLQCSVDSKDPVFLCVLVPEKSETCHLELEFEEENVTFSVIGPRSVHLAGYYIFDQYEGDNGDSDAGSDDFECSDDDGFVETDDDGNMVMLDQMATDSEDDDSEYDSETDDEEMVYNHRRGKNSVVIEEIQEDDNPAGDELQKVSNKKQDSDKSQLQLAVRTPAAESLESEDEDGFPVSFSESKKRSESISKKNMSQNKEPRSEDRKRKSGAVSDNHDSSGEVNGENDGASKKKKKAKDKGTTMDGGKLNTEEKEIKQQDPPADPADVKQKKKKNKKVRAAEADTDQQSAKKNHIHKDGEEVTAQEANKKNKKKKTQDTNRSENQAPSMESENKKGPLQTREFPNGLKIEEIAYGKPDGKKAANGKKVSVRYIGKLKNGKIFDSNVSGRPFEFRLGIGEVIKGWDIGVNGMRIGDKRRITVPPSMGYGNKRMGPIPQNSTLIFDVELVNVK